MKTTSLALLFLVFTHTLQAVSIVFDDFSTVTVSPTTSGSLTDSGFTLTLSGDEGLVFSDFANGYTQALILGNNTSNRINSLTLTFSEAQTVVSLNLDAMHAIQSDRITASTGEWTTVPAALDKTSPTVLEATGALVDPGGAGIDDDLDVTLTFAAPTNSVTFTNVGAFALDSVTVMAVPEPSTGLLALTGFLGLTAYRRRQGR